MVLERDYAAIQSLLANVSCMVDSKKMINILQDWIELVQRARAELTPARYEDWRFIVGHHGSLEERYNLGSRALQYLTETKASQFIYFNEDFHKLREAFIDLEDFEERIAQAVRGAM